MAEMTKKNTPRARSAGTRKKTGTRPGVPRQPWHQQPGETAKQWACFLVYRDTPAPSRSVSEAVRQSPTPLGNAHELAKRHHWLDRATAWDHHLERLNATEQEAATRDMARRHVAISRRLQELAMVSAERYLEQHNQGQDPVVASRDIARLVEVATKLERTALGQPAEITETRENIDLSGLDLHELRQLRRLSNKIKTPGAARIDDPRLQELGVQPTGGPSEPDTGKGA